MYQGVGGALLPRSTTTGGGAGASSDGPAAKADEAARKTIGTRRKFSEHMASNAQKQDADLRVRTPREKIAPPEWRAPSEDLVLSNRNRL